MKSNSIHQWKYIYYLQHSRCKNARLTRFKFNIAFHTDQRCAQMLLQVENINSKHKNLFELNHLE